MLVRGSNAVTKHMVAALLGEGPSVIRGVPEVGDVAVAADILRSLGVGVEHDEAAGAITVEPHEAVTADVPLSFSGLNRIPILLLGPLLHRTGKAFVPLVGGDQIGRCTVDFHMKALERPRRHDRGAPPTGCSPRPAACGAPEIELPYPSVGATETVLLSPRWPRGAPSCATRPPSPR